MRCDNRRVQTLQRQTNPTLKKLKALSDELDTAERTSEATTKEVQHARRMTQSVKLDVRRQMHTAHVGRKHRGSKKRSTSTGKNKAAVELGQKGGRARARTMTPKQRSVLAEKAANARWKSL
jgi:hypothetical protein